MDAKTLEILSRNPEVDKAATKYAIRHLETVLDHKWFRKSGKNYIIDPDESPE